MRSFTSFIGRSTACSPGKTDNKPRRNLRAALVLGTALAALGLVACNVDADIDLDLGFVSGVSCADKGACDPGFLCFEGSWCVATGALRISLGFEVDSDFDLHVKTPGGSEIMWKNRTANGGELDVDQCVEPCGSGQHVENVYFADEPANGTYEIWIENYSGGGVDPRGAGAFTIEIAAGNELTTLSGSLPAQVGAESEHYTLDWPTLETGIAGEGGMGGMGGEGGSGGAGGN